MDKRIILVTGGAGYIGSHACKALALNGYTPVVYDNLVMGHKDFVKWGPFEQGDIRDQKKLKEVFERYKPIAIFHFAAFGYVGESVVNPAKYYENNVTGTISLLNVMNECGVKKIVFSSTCATYGMPTKFPITETTLQTPINPYGMSKLMIEKILQDYDRAYGIKHIIFRYFNAAGADEANVIGEDHTPESHLIPLVLDVALGKRSCVTVFGDDYDTSDGTCVRDYLHVSDIAQAHIRALSYFEQNETSDYFNLGIGNGFSVKEIIETVQAVTKKNIVVKIEARRPGDPPVLVADASKANRILGWIPKYYNLAMMITHAWAWHQKRFAKELQSGKNFINCSNI